VFFPEAIGRNIDASRRFNLPEGFGGGYWPAALVVTA
jgi:hypothetical protein